MIPDESDIPDIPDDPVHPTHNKKMMIVLPSYPFDNETLLWTEKASRIVILYPSCILNLAGYVRAHYWQELNSKLVLKCCLSCYSVHIPLGIHLFNWSLFLRSVVLWLFFFFCFFRPCSWGWRTSPSEADQCGLSEWSPEGKCIHLLLLFPIFHSF